MRPTLGFVLLLGALAACDSAPTEPTVTDVSGSLASLKTVASTTNVSTPINFELFIPCGNGGAGEFVDLHGRLHTVFHVTVHPDGTFTMKEHDQPQGLGGFGEESGNFYRGVGVTQEPIRQGRVGATHTFVNNFKFIGTGNSGSFRVHETFHVTVNANGTVTASVDHLTATCK